LRPVDKQGAKTTQRKQGDCAKKGKPPVGSFRAQREISGRTERFPVAVLLEITEIYFFQNHQARLAFPGSPVPHGNAGVIAGASAANFATACVAGQGQGPVGTCSLIGSGLLNLNSEHIPCQTGQTVEARRSNSLLVTSFSADKSSRLSFSIDPPFGWFAGRTPRQASLLQEKHPVFHFEPSEKSLKQWSGFSSLCPSKGTVIYFLRNHQNCPTPLPGKPFAYRIMKQSDCNMLHLAL